MEHHHVVDTFKAYLRDHNLPVTSQRVAIAEAVLTSNRHLSAEDVATDARKSGASVGRAWTE